MNQEEKALLDKLLEVYTKLYPSREIFRENLFSYNPKEAAKIFNGIGTHTDDFKEVNPIKNSSSPSLKDEINGISTVEQVRAYITKLGLLGDQSDLTADSKLKQKTTSAEYRHLYSILYSTPISAKTKKEILINHIVNYFNSIDRAQALKP